MRFLEVVVALAIEDPSESCVSRNTGPFRGVSSVVFLLSSLCFIIRIGYTFKS